MSAWRGMSTESNINDDHEPEVEVEYAIVNILHGAAEILHGVRRWVLANAHMAEERADGLQRDSEARAQESTRATESRSRAHRRGSGRGGGS